MKKDIHPKYYIEAEVSCACGNVFYVGSTKEKLSTEICYKCHPFYTGEEKLVDTTGRVEKFKIRREKAKTTTRSKKQKRAVKSKKSSEKKTTTESKTKTTSKKKDN